MPKIPYSTVSLTSASINTQVEKIRALLNMQLDADNIYRDGKSIRSIDNDMCKGLASHNQPISAAKFFEHTEVKHGLDNEIKYEVDPDEDLFMEYIGELKKNREFSVITGSTSFIHNKDTLKMNAEAGRIIGTRTSTNIVGVENETDVRVSERSMSTDMEIPKPSNYEPVTERMASLYDFDLSSFYTYGGIYGFLNVYVEGDVGSDSTVYASFVVSKVEADKITGTMNYSVSNIFNDDRITIMVDYVVLCEVLK